MTESSGFRIAMIVIVALLIVALLAYARGNPGDGGRFPDRDSVASTLHLGG